MGRITCFIALASAAAASQIARQNALSPVSGLVPGGGSVAPHFTVNLDLPPAQRWVQPVTAMLDAYGFNNTVGGVLEWLDTLVPEEIQALLEPILDMLPVLIPSPYKDEIDGIFDVLAEAAPWANGTLLTRGKLYFMNLIYEFTAFCTSIVTAVPPVGGNGPHTLLHGRNLDYDIPLLNITASVTFTRSGQTAYVGGVFLGYVGLLTGMRPGGWSVSVDQRDYNQTSQPVEQFLDNLASAALGGKSIGMFLRDSLENIPDFDTAAMTLNATRLIAPVYLTVCGTTGDQGVVITRAREHADDSHGWALAMNTMNVSAGKWYRDVTNYDFWVPDPPTDPRRTAAEKMMNALGYANMSASSVLDVLSSSPVLNSGTLYTMIMVPGTGDFAMYVRNATWVDVVAQEARAGQRAKWNPQRRDWATRG